MGAAREGALVWQGKEESGPCRGGQVYRGSCPHYLDLAPVWVPDAALLCDPARRARSLWRRIMGWGNRRGRDGTAFGCPDNALAECCGQGRWPREDFFVWFYL